MADRSAAGLPANLDADGDGLPNGWELQYGLDRLSSVGVNGANERAYRCYKACGFVEEGRRREQVWSNGRYDDYIEMGLLDREWAAARAATA